MPSNEHNDRRQGQPPQGGVQASANDAFVRHLEHASSVVRTWPTWAQEILGGTASHPNTNPPRNRSS